MVQILMLRAAAHLALQNYPAALADVRAARRLQTADPRLLLLQKQIEKAIHAATHKDYYTILGLRRCVGRRGGSQHL